MHKILGPLVSTLALAALTLPGVAQDMRSVTDHANYTVEIPVDPQRIVSLHDWTATVMTYELGGNLIGSSGRLDNEGNYFVRSGRELYDLGFDQIEMASVHGELDMERIAALKPDLIIGNLGDTIEFRDQLAAIAPTVIFDPMNGQPPLANYRTLADWVARPERFDELNAEYETRIDEVRAELFGDRPAPSYAAILPNTESGELRVFRNYGALTTVLEDLGFTHASIMDQVPETEQEANFSAEVIAQVDSDYAFLTHISDRGESLETIMTEFDQIAPGYRELLPAAKNGRFISMSRFHVYPTTFAAMNYVLDELVATLK
ncbi:MAG: ABC transporter substrate-binding protein [Candidatus Devosia phytovorans]|uniref:ABC transporter substrate-binding protein n=1 Tax=Candidatus Devosia phytovorans TaxID=3121372 RepID=A0AAJ5VRG5_9HYPH|nr:ABC transporter substrate-binding protein [Devosia sp.]WEK02892.1 MAG: ABC transporter substrate-binding protein [Devosia sp.]